MTITLSISNFRIIKEAELRDDHKVSYILGSNESGKTSLVQAIQVVFTNACGSLRAGDLGALVHHGADKGFSISLRLGDGMDFSRTRTSGTGVTTIAAKLGVPQASLPLLVSAEACGDGGSKAMKQFLEATTQSTFDPLAVFIADPIVRPKVEQAIRDNRSKPDQIVRYAEEMRAGCKSPVMPVAPTMFRMADSDIELRRQEVAEAERSAAQASEAYTSFTALMGNLRAIRQYLLTKAAVTAATEAATEDPLATTRIALQRVSSGSSVALRGWDAMLTDAFGPHAAEPVKQAVAAVERYITMAREYLAKNPAPPGIPPMPEFPASAKDLIEATKDFSIDKLDEIIRAAAQKEDEVRSAHMSARTRMTSARAELEKALQVKGAWQTYDATRVAYDAEVVRAEQDWDAWDKTAKAVAAAMLEHVAATSAAFGQLVETIGAQLLQGRRVRIDRAEGIFLGPDPIDTLVSASARWRVQVAIMTAIGRTLKSPILVIDAADILDMSNREAFDRFLVTEAIPYFRHIIVTSTWSGAKPTMQTSPGIGIWWLERGELSRLSSE